MHSKSLRVLYINLDRSPDRRLYIETEIERVWSNALKRIVATDGSELDCEHLRRKRVLAESRTLGRLLKPGEVGAWMSHFRAWRQTRSTSYSGSVIVEDDIKFIDSFTRQLELRSEELAASGTTWHVCFLGCLEGAGSWSPKLGGSPRLPGGFVRLNAENGGCPGAYGYIIHREAARLLVNLGRRTKIDRPVDELLRFAFESGQLEALCASPPLVRHGLSAVGRKFSSTISD